MADFAIAESASAVRRAVREELESLRLSITMEPRCELGLNERQIWRDEIDRRLAALGEQTDKAGGGSSDTAGSQPVRAEQPPALSDADWLAMRNATEHRRRSTATEAEQTDNGPEVSQETPRRLEGNLPERSATPPARLSDAEALERAAKILDESTRGLGGVVREVAAKLRAASAPKPVDVFEAFARDPVDYDAETLGGRARNWFSPLVEALDNIRQHGNSYAVREATAALSELRRKSSAEGAGPARSEGPERKAQEASRG